MEKLSEDQFSPSKRSWIMSKVKSKDNPAELSLRKALWKRGLRYRIHCSSIPGVPDVLFLKAKVAVFVDGAFWHGTKLSEERLNKMSPYWQGKLRKNKERDISVNSKLESQGYTVIRLSEQEALKNADAIAESIDEIVTRKRD